MTRILEAGQSKWHHSVERTNALLLSINYEMKKIICSNWFRHERHQFDPHCDRSVITISSAIQKKKKTKGEI